MQIHPIDWLVIAGYCVAALAIGAYYSRRASSSMEEFFVAGRNLPWWVAGTSIVATTFAADTPLFVSGLIRTKGIYGNWMWWNLVFGGMLCTFFYAHLWRRAGVLTDIEFIELRYAGRRASVLRAFMAVFRGVYFNALVMGWVMVAMTKICGVMLGWDKFTSVGVMVVMALAYTVLSGFWGVVMTDMIQFVMAMIGSISLAVIVLVKMGGPVSMVEQVRAAEGFRPEILQFMPTLGTAGSLAMFTFAIQLSLQWLPKGQGDGYLAQRLFSTKDERHSVLASLWFNYACYVLRPWPWIIVGLASLVFFPLETVEDHEAVYASMVARFMPVGLLGLMVASLLAAFMSTIDTQLNWGASYLVNDLYRRFMVREASERHYVWVSRLAVVFLALCAAVATWQIETIEGAWTYLAVLMSGPGLVLLLRWYWWRINAWSEISAMVSSFVLANGMLLVRLVNAAYALPKSWMQGAEWLYSGDGYAVRLSVVFAVSTVIWIAVTFLTQPVAEEHLTAFFRRVRPGGWWGPLAAKNPEVERQTALQGWLGWVMGVLCIYLGLFGLGYICLGRYGVGAAILVMSFAAGAITLRAVPASNENSPKGAIGVQ